MTETTTLRWFGHPYDAPAWDGMWETETPVGDLCGACGYTIAADDDGLTIPRANMSSERVPYHLTCFVRSILGPKAPLPRRRQVP